MKNNNLMFALLSAVVLSSGPAALPVSAQLAFATPTPAYQPLSDQQLDLLLGPIALYPDPLLAQLLPAAAQPAQIVLANRYLAGGGDPNLIDQQPWDSSVQALARYPSVLQYLDRNLAWTTELGQAFLNQQDQVMESVQRLRQSAMNYGNLQSTPQEQVVVDDNGYIEILPAQPDVIYLPIYQPVYVYDQSGYGVSFGAACAIGPWLNCDFDWHGRHLFFWGRQQPRPVNWWREQPAQRQTWLARQGTIWRPDDHRGVAASRAGDRGWVNPAPRPAQPNNAMGNMSRLGASPRPEAPLRQAPGREPGTIHLPSTPAPAFRPGTEGAFIGSDSSRDARTFSNRGQESMQAVPHSEPVHSEPARVEPAHVEPPHFEPPVSHSEPSSGGGGGGRR